MFAGMACCCLNTVFCPFLLGCAFVYVRKLLDSIQSEAVSKNHFYFHAYLRVNIFYVLYIHIKYQSHLLALILGLFWACL